MKKVILFIMLILTSIISFSDSYITRGPSTGEIYFIGPTFTGMGVYYSTDFGETAICMDSIIAGYAISIAADKHLVSYIMLQASKVFMFLMIMDNKVLGAYKIVK